MVTKRIDLQNTPTNLEELLTLLNDDTEILLTRGDTPLARLSPVEQPPAAKAQRIPGLDRGTTWVSNDFDLAL